MHPESPLPFYGSVGKSHESGGGGWHTGYSSQRGLGLASAYPQLPALPPTQNPSLHPPNTQREVPSPCLDPLGKPMWPTPG